MLYLYLLFLLLSQQSDALNSLIPDVFANSNTFSLSMIPSIGAFWLLFPTNKWKNAYVFRRSSRSLCFHVKKTFLSVPKKLSVCAYFSLMEKECFLGHHTLLSRPYVIPISESFKASHFTPIGWLFNLRFMGTIFLSQRTKNGLFEFMALCLCFQKSNAWFENVGMFEFWSKSLNCIEKARIDEKKFESWREIHPSYWQISSTYRDVQVFKYSSYRYFFCLNRVSRFKGPTNLFNNMYMFVNWLLLRVQLWVLQRFFIKTVTMCLRQWC